jgi:hypothetical protein
MAFLCLQCVWIMTYRSPDTCAGKAPLRVHVRVVNDSLRADLVASKVFSGMGVVSWYRCSVDSPEGAVTTARLIQFAMRLVRSLPVATRSRFDRRPQLAGCVSAVLAASAAFAVGAAPRHGAPRGGGFRPR